MVNKHWIRPYLCLGGGVLTLGKKGRLTSHKRERVFPKIGGFPPKSSILMGISGISTKTHPFWGYLPLFCGNTRIFFAGPSGWKWPRTEPQDLFFHFIDLILSQDEWLVQWGSDFGEFLREVLIMGTWADPPQEIKPRSGRTIRASLKKGMKVLWNQLRSETKPWWFGF